MVSKTSPIGGVFLLVQIYNLFYKNSKLEFNRYFLSKDYNIQNINFKLMRVFS